MHVAGFVELIRTVVMDYFETHRILKRKMDVQANYLFETNRNFK